MPKLLEPWNTFYRVSDIDYELLKENDIAYLLLDMDNTLVPWHTLDVSVQMLQWTRDMREHGVELFIISNNSKARTQALGTLLDMGAAWDAMKPFSRGFKVLKKRHQLDPARTAIVGDQIFTDVLGSKFWHIKGILVAPLSAVEGRWTRFMRFWERIIARRKL